MAQVIRLSAPAGRQFRGERGVNEPGDGRSVRAIGIPLQGKRNQLAGRYGPDRGPGVRGREGRDEQDPLDVRLVGPAVGGQVGVGQVDRGRADTRGFQGLALAQGPGGEQVRRGGAQDVVG